MRLDPGKEQYVNAGGNPLPAAPFDETDAAQWKWTFIVFFGVAAIGMIGMYLEKIGWITK